MYHPREWGIRQNWRTAKVMETAQAHPIQFHKAQQRWAQQNRDNGMAADSRMLEMRIGLRSKKYRFHLIEHATHQENTKHAHHHVMLHPSICWPSDIILLKAYTWRNSSKSVTGSRNTLLCSRSWDACLLCCSKTNAYHPLFLALWLCEIVNWVSTFIDT